MIAGARHAAHHTHPTRWSRLVASFVSERCNRLPRPMGYSRAMLSMDGIGWIVVGFIAGAISGALLGGKTARGCLPNVVVGILGGLLGGLAGEPDGLRRGAGLHRRVVVAVLGSLVDPARPQRDLARQLSRRWRSCRRRLDDRLRDASDGAATIDA